MTVITNVLKELNELIDHSPEIDQAHSVPTRELNQSFHARTLIKYELASTITQFQIIEIV